MRLSLRVRRILAAAVVLGILVFFELKAASRPACTPTTCPLPIGDDVRQPSGN